MREGLTERDLAYLGGFFDGEGSVGIYRRGKWAPVMSTTVVQNRSPAVEALIFGWRDALGGSVSTNRSASGRAKLQWQASGETAAGLLRAIQPYLVLKREQVELALRFQGLKPGVVRGPDGRNTRQVVTEEMEALILQVKVLKVGEPF